MDMHEIVTQAREMRATGATEDQIRDWIDRQIPDSAPFDQPRYQCIACLDRGHVEIWHPAEVARVKIGKTEPTCFCMIDCSCKQESNNRYDPGLHCRVVGWDSIEQKRETLRFWLAERERIESHPNYRAEFAEFAMWLIAVGTLQFSG